MHLCIHGNDETFIFILSLSFQFITAPTTPVVISSPRSLFFPRLIMMKMLMQLSRRGGSDGDAAAEDEVRHSPALPQPMTGGGGYGGGAVLELTMTL